MVLTDRETVTLEQEEGRPAEKERENAIESVFSGLRLPMKLHKEILSYGVKCAIDCTPGQGEMLKACLDSRIPVLALCLTEKHAEALEERLTHYCLDKFKDNTHTLFRADCKIEVKKTVDSEEDTPKPLPPAVPKPKPGNKRKRKESASSEESSDKKKSKKKKKGSSEDGGKKKKRKSSSAESW